MLSGSEYKKITETSDSQKKREYWNTAIGLQQVDGLVPSDYLLELAEQNIAGKLSYAQVEDSLAKHYAAQDFAIQSHREMQEADIVSSRIVQALDTMVFALSPDMLKGIHAWLFSATKSVGENAGLIRTYDIMKDEPILFGKSVHYSNHLYITPTLNTFFQRESVAMREYGYPFTNEQLQQLARFTADIWHVHPFVEGNTKTIAVFIELYLRWLGYDIDNTPFEKHAHYFRDALVRASYFNNRLGVPQTTEYLQRF
ncbi:MAG: Fic family protein, partial [Coriobacteriales bacterium]|nr:Fic family protein [Coriobacteriales bacterium]